MNKKISYRYIIAFGFASLFFIETFCNMFMVAGYYIDTNAYAANCINKDKPQMHCNGKCQLQKKLNEENNKDKQAPERKNETGNEVLSSKSFFAVVQTQFASSIINKYFIIDAEKPVNNSSGVFHPPQSFFI